MLGIHDFWLFLVSGILLNLTPGQDTFYILGRSVAGGTRIGIVSVLGITTGTLVHTIAAALGLSTLLATSATAFTVVKLAGAAYLIYLGARMLFTSAAPVDAVAEQSSRGHWAAYRDGVLSNVLNPKVALFFLAFLPQFIDAGSHNKVLAFVTLGLTFVTTGAIWCFILVIAAARFRAFFIRNPSARALIERCVGGLFMALGARLAFAK